MYQEKYTEPLSNEQSPTNYVPKPKTELIYSKEEKCEHLQLQLDERDQCGGGEIISADIYIFADRVFTSLSTGDHHVYYADDDKDIDEIADAVLCGLCGDGFMYVEVEHWSNCSEPPSENDKELEPEFI